MYFVYFGDGGMLVGHPSHVKTMIATSSMFILVPHQQNPTWKTTHLQCLHERSVKLDKSQDSVEVENNA
jgi:hypothetical protein